MWITILIIAVVIGGVLGFLGSDDGDGLGGFISGAVSGGMGCGYILLRLFFIWLIIMGAIWLFS